MTYSQKYTIVHFVAPVENGAEFHMRDWPLHVTLADVFAVDRTGTAIDAKIKALAAHLAACEVEATEEASLGEARVMLLQKTPQIVALHLAIVNLLEQNGVVFNTPEFTRGGFLPHSTIQRTGRLDPGDSVRIDTISLVDMLPAGDWQRRRVLKTITLSAA